MQRSPSSSRSLRQSCQQGFSICFISLWLIVDVFFLNIILFVCLFISYYHFCNQGAEVAVLVPVSAPILFLEIGHMSQRPYRSENAASSDRLGPRRTNEQQDCFSVSCLFVICHVIVILLFIKPCAVRIFYHNYVLQNRDSRHRGSGTSDRRRPWRYTCVYIYIYI